MNYNLSFKTLPKDPSLKEDFDVEKCNDYSLPSFAVNFLKTEAVSYEAREDDVYIVSYPGTGTTWMQEFLYLVHVNADFTIANSSSPSARFFYIEDASASKFVKKMPSPRLLRSHLPYSLLPPDIHKKKCKIVYVTRNPRDVAVTYYHFVTMQDETIYKGNFALFFERFINNRVAYSPFFKHNLEFWNQRDNANILFLFYEDMHQNPVENVKSIADFLGKSLTEKEINSIIEDCTTPSISKFYIPGAAEHAAFDRRVNHISRKGDIGDWQSGYFNAEQISRLDKELEEVLDGSGLSYTYDL